MKSTQRRWMYLIVTATVAAALTACSSGATDPADDSSPEDSPVTLTYVSYGGTGQDAQIKAWQEPYTAENPHVTFANTSPPDPAQVKAQVEAGSVTWDIVTTAPYLAAEQCGVLYEELDIQGLDPSHFGEGDIGKCYVTDFRYGIIFSYNPEKWPDPATAPKTVEDYFDLEKFPGKRGVVPTVQDGVLEWALLADGVAAEDLYPLDVDRAIAKWDTIKDETLFAANPGALLQLVTSGQVDMQILVQARSQAVLDAGTDMTPVWDKTLTSLDGLAIPLGSKNKAAAEKFISFLLQPEHSEKMSELAGIGPANLTAKPTLTPNGEKVNAFGSQNTGETIQINAEWWGQNFNQVAERFTQWLNG